MLSCCGAAQQEGNAMTNHASIDPCQLDLKVLGAKARRYAFPNVSDGVVLLLLGLVDPTVCDRRMQKVRRKNEKTSGRGCAGQRRFSKGDPFRFSRLPH